MVRKISSLIVMMLFIGVGIVSCKKEPKTDSDSEVITVEGSDDYNKTDAYSEVEFSDKNVQIIYHNYLSVKAAMVNSSSGTVQKEAAKMVETSKGYKEMQATVKLISLTKDIDKQRDFFAALTEEVEKILTSTAIVSGEVYKQYCPMAFDGNGGYWFSNSKEIRNPYYGTKMLECGEVNAVLKRE